MQQPPDNQQQFSQYPQHPQQGPFGPPPMQQPPKKKSRRRLWLIIAAVIVVLAACGGISSALSHASAPTTSTSGNTSSANTPTSSSATQASTQPTAAPKPTQAPKWTTIQTFTGNGTKKTALFAVPGDWKINWSCDGMIAGTSMDGLLAVAVYGSDGSIVDPAAVNATCKAGTAKTSDSTEEHQSGSVYLDINGTGDWSITIQVLK